MTHDRQERIKEVFEEAAQREPSERSAYLDEQCREDAALRSAVESLLAAGEGAGSFLEGPPRLSVPEAVSLASTLTSESSESAGVVGRYRLLEKLGEGGMGEVWLAEQQEPVRRRVALKLIKAGMDTAQVIARFEAERQALALMDHPAIAKVFDAGATGAGRPYFVMEHVSGLPITRHCDEQRLGVEQRLELFLQVCEGVQHAHRKAVLHRDLKPSNVLVASQDGRATPKIIDFGVAKAMSQPLTARTLYTGLGMLVGTPGYMSPEQADLGGQDVDTRTDVYSLGVMLYELLVGELPFGREQLRQAGWEGLSRLLRQQEPATPSRRLSTLPPGTSAELSSFRQEDAPGLRRRLSGDLDWITMKAIEADRERRYGTPSDLAEDIRRHLRDEPVLASSPGAAYRMRKFVRRHRLAVAAAGVVALVVAAGLVGTTVGLVRARRAESEATKQAQTSERVSGFLAGVLGSIDPERMGQTLVADLRQRVEKAERARGGDEAHVGPALAAFDGGLSGVNQVDLARQIVDREILVPAGKTIEEEMADEPLVAARLQSTMGWTYQSLSLFPAAESFHVRALETRRRNLGPEHPETLQSLFGLARSYHAQGRFAEAEKVLRETYEIQRRVRGPEHPDTLQSMGRLGAAIHDQGGRYQEAEVLFREAVEIRRRVLGEDHPDTAITMRYLADTLSSLKRGEEAVQAFREALDRLRRAFGPEHHETLNCMNNLGNLYAGQGRDREAERIRLEVLETRIRVFGKEHYMTQAAMTNLGSTYREQGRYEEAERLLTEAAALRRRNVEGKVVAIVELGHLYLDRGRAVEAEALYREALDIRRRVLGEDSPDTVAAMRHLGDSLRSQRRYAEAEALYRDALDRNRRARGVEHDETRFCMNRLAGIYVDQGRTQEAERLYLEVIDTMRAHGEDDERTNFAKSNLAYFYSTRGRHEEAEKLLKEVVAVRRRVLAEVDPARVSAIVQLANAHYGRGRLKEAESLYREALEVRRRVLGEEHVDTAIMMRLLADCLRSQQRYAEAETLYREALDRDRRARGPEHDETQLCMSQLAGMYASQGRTEEAERLYVEVLEARRRARGEEDERTNSAKNSLGYFYFTQARHEEAERLLESVVAVRRRVLPVEDPSRVVAVINLGDVYVARRRYADAKPLYEEVLDMRRRTLGAEDPRTISTLDRLIKLHRDAGHRGTARSLVRSALAARKRGAERPEADARLKNEYAWSLLTSEPADLRDPREALKFALEAAAATDRKDAAVLDTLALAYHMTGSTAEALGVQKEALGLLPEGPSPLRAKLEEKLAEYEEALRK